MNKLMYFYMPSTTTFSPGTKSAMTAAAKAAGIPESNVIDLAATVATATDSTKTSEEIAAALALLNNHAYWWYIAMNDASVVKTAENMKKLDATNFIKVPKGRYCMPSVSFTMKGSSRVEFHISWIFTRIPQGYNLVSISGGTGTIISDESSKIVKEGGEFTFTAALEDGYENLAVETSNGTVTHDESAYTVSDITEPCTITVSAAAKTVTATLTNSDGKVTFDPASGAEATVGTTFTSTLTFTEGYELDTAVGTGCTASVVDGILSATGFTTDFSVAVTSKATT